MKLKFFMIISMLYQLVICASDFDKVVIWGHKLHTHTHSYVHEAFHKAFRHLGYPTYWFDNDDDAIKSFDFSRTLFITEGQVDDKMPVRKDCLYILHNCGNKKYDPLFKLGRCIRLQVYTNDLLTRPNLTKIDDFMYYNVQDQTIYLPWATDLLPHEIEAMKSKIFEGGDGNIIWYVGTIGDGLYGNRSELSPFQKACRENGMDMQQVASISVKEHIRAIKKSPIAPVIVGAWQKQHGYIPCRGFKNVSYGKMICTNSKEVYELFKKKVIFNADSYQLFYDFKKKMESTPKEVLQQEIVDLMDYVSINHTYLNRINAMLDFFNLVQKTCGHCA